MGSQLEREDGKNEVVQAFKCPLTGSTVAITTSSAASAKTVAALVGGMYRVVSTVDVSLASGLFASVTAAAADMPLLANQAEYFGVPAGHSIAAYDAGAGSATVSITKV